MSAVETILERAKCVVQDGGRDAEAVIRESYDLEVYEWLQWELLKEVFCAGDLIDADIEEDLIQYLIDECEDEVQDYIDDAEEEEYRELEEQLEQAEYEEVEEQFEEQFEEE